MDHGGDAVDTSAPTRRATPLEVRAEFERLVVDDLYGPAGGESEALSDGTPSDRYLVGMLAPKGSPSAYDPQREEPDPVDSGDEAPADQTAPKHAVFPSSKGLSFAVPSDAGELLVEVSWGAYRREETAAPERTAPDQVELPVSPPGPDIPELDGSATTTAVSPQIDAGPTRVWQRYPVVAKVPLRIPAGGGELEPIAVHDEHPGVHLVGRATQAGGAVLVSLFLVNGQLPQQRLKDERWMFQAEFSVTAGDGAAVFIGRDRLLRGTELNESDDERGELARLAMLYRRHVEFAVGHGTAVHTDVSPQDYTRATRVGTVSVPRYEVPRTDPPRPGEPGFPGLDRAVLDMKELAGLHGPALVEAVEPLVAGYRQWLADQRARLGAADLAEHADVAEGSLGDADRIADRLEEAVQLLAADADAREAFRFVNHTMWQQRVRTSAVAIHRAGGADSVEAALVVADVPSNRSWRPFQIAFLLLNLPSLTDPLNLERGQPGLVDLLFFPTGGGKTEAYLGLTAYTFAIRRLQGDRFGRDGSAGVAVLMRYTLRLLTAQQFQRATTMVCAAELERRRDEKVWGATPFRIGLWVGGSVTPNRFEDAESFVEDAHGWGKASGRSSISPVPFTECPWCGSTIQPKTDVVADKSTRRVRIYCGDTTGRCEFTMAKNRDGLPVLTVDEEIYRYPPSLLIATVDKFAQLPRNGASGHLFGHVTRECGRHGFKHADIRQEVCGADKHNAQNGLPATVTTIATRLRPVDLIIQDELHLISDALGTMVGLYETAVDELATWEVEGRRVRPKVVASTATVRRAEEQAYALFRRQLAIFPPPGLDVEDSFFARQLPVDAAHPGRRYLGVCAQGIRLKSVEIRVTSALMTFTQMLFDDHGAVADPYMTMVGYFNALRELGGMRRLVEDDVAARLSRPLHRDMPGRVAPMPRRRAPFMEELTSRVSSRAIKDTLKAIEVPFDPAQDTTAARTAASNAAKAARGKKKTPAKKAASAPPRIIPKDVVLATSMFGVGVDIPRLGLMTVTGQPKATSEYIQATSRVGRDPSRPGLVVTIYNWARPRDLSHYERFGHYHDTFYQQVEALSVTPFSIPAVNRAITGAFLGALRHLHPTFNPDTGLNAVVAGDSEVERLLAHFVDRASAITGRDDSASAVEAMLRKRLQHLASRRDAAQGQTLLAYRGGKEGVVTVLHNPESGIGWDMWTVPNSLRETEPEINLQLLTFDPTIDNPSSHVPKWAPASAQTTSGDQDGGHDA